MKTAKAILSRVRQGSSTYSSGGKILCCNCLYHGTAYTQTKGRAFLELRLWSFLSILGFLYSAWRRSTL